MFQYLVMKSLELMNAYGVPQGSVLGRYLFDLFMLWCISNSNSLVSNEAKSETLIDAKFLGLYIDDNIKWHFYIDFLTKKKKINVIEFQMTSLHLELQQPLTLETF